MPSTPHDPLALLHDGVGAITAIRTWLSERSREDYLRDEMRRRAVEREFEILGESLRRLETRHPEIAQRISDRRMAIATRNIIAHGYDVVDHHILWDIAQQDLPSMERTLSALLEALKERLP